MKFKRIILPIAAAVLSAFASAVMAATPVTYDQNFVDEAAGVAYSTTPVLDLSTNSIAALSVQASYSSVTFSAASFTDGSPSTGTISVPTTTVANIAGVSATNTLGINNNAALALRASTDTLNVTTTTDLSGRYFTLNGAVLRNPNDWSVGSSSIATAANIAAAINARVGGFSATSSGSTVTITANAPGSAGNAYTLTTSTPAALAANSALFRGGLDAATLTIAGRVFIANVDWTVADVASNTAVNIKTLFNANAISGIAASTTSASTVTFTVSAVGTAGNAYTLVSSTQNALQVGSTTTFTGGQSPVVITIAGTSLTASVDFTPASTSSGTAKAISDAITANSTLNLLMSATWYMVSTSSVGVVSATTSANGLTTLYNLTSSNQSYITTFAAHMTGGTNTAILTASSRLHLPAHGFVKALPVLYAKTAGTSPGQLVTGTTYYVIVNSSDDVKLAATSTGAVAGLAVAITTQTATGGGTFSLTALPFTGTWSFKWQASDDATNYYDLPVSSITFSTAGATAWDGPTYFHYLRLNLTAGTAGALSLKARAFGR